MSSDSREPLAFLRKQKERYNCGSNQFFKLAHLVWNVGDLRALICCSKLGPVLCMVSYISVHLRSHASALTALGSFQLFTLRSSEAMLLSSKRHVSSCTVLAVAL